MENGVFSIECSAEIFQIGTLLPGNTRVEPRPAESLTDKQSGPDRFFGDAVTARALKTSVRCVRLIKSAAFSFGTPTQTWF